MQTQNEIFKLPVDVLKNITSYLLTAQDKIRFIGSCQSFFSNPELKKDIRAAYIKTFLTEHPKLIQAYSEEKAFNTLCQDFIIPFEKAVFPIQKPKKLETIPAFTEGTYQKQEADLVCFKLGFEKLYLQLFQSTMEFSYSKQYEGSELTRQAKSGLSHRLQGSMQRYVITKYQYPITLLMAMTQIDPYLYFIALAETLINGRFDLFDGLLDHFEENKDYLTHERCILQKPNRLFIGHHTNENQKTADLTLENIKDWSPQFEYQYDRIGFADYFGNNPAHQALFDLCLAKRAQTNSSHPVHFLWACYAGDSNDILNHLNNSDFSIETLQESPLALYAHNVNPEEAGIIAMLLDNPTCRNMMHSRNTMQQTPVQIAIRNNKFELVIALLANTDDETLKKVYNTEERAYIDRAMIGHLEGLPAIQPSEPELEPTVDSNSCRIC